MIGKISRSQREERRTFFKLVVGAGVGAALVGGIGLAVMRMMPLATLEGSSTIAARLAEAGLDDWVFLLAGEGDPDVLIVGSTDCIHCQNFVSKGLDALLAAAVEEGWTVAYLPLATGPASLVSAHALSLVADAQDKPSALRATYMLSSLVRNEGLAADDQGTRFAALVGDPTLAARWTSPDVDKMAVYMRALVTAFNVKSTPSFYVQSKDGTEVRMFSGFVDGGRVVEQIRAHR